MPEKLVGKGAEPGRKGEKMIIILILGPRYTEEWLSGDKLKDKAAETPDMNSIVNSTGKNRFRSLKTEWSNGLCWWISEEICC